MVLNDNGIAVGDTQSLNIFDAITNVAFGDGINDPSISDTVLQNELLRVSDIISVKDTGDNTYTITARVPITKLNSTAISELGLFDASSGGNLGGKIKSTLATIKTSDKERIYTIRVKVQTINN